ncbi:hypothetical protein WR25_05381 [Diploscapter pachys]|uniref:O-phosphoseryl-tRNA(Sec) selenium transferase n=1 Tax=Diploscapter pachys TaxID=2018661 RepID=A0A2A2KA14_9BILA|nr:hypothetical protein WR25_05381 [Diploscapter pachys]
MKASFGKREEALSNSVSKSTHKMLANLWEKKDIPEEGWPEHMVERLLSWLASHDTNNRVDSISIGAGEREGRVASPLVRRLHCNLSHGVGRSGSLDEIQPKAIGSSMLACLANEFALHSLHVAGISTCKAAIVVPLCTGMSLSLCMTSFRKQRPNAKYVVWSRIDQKSCFKSIYHAGFKPIIVDLVRERDALVTDVQSIARILEERGKQVVCVMTTTSCFAPRSPDNLPAIARICAEHGVPHLVNNAYGVQSEHCCRLINEASTSGRLDAFVQSLDKNFQVPVGGAIIAARKQSVINSIAKTYPGRASLVPARDLVLTLLHTGKRGFIQSLEQQKRLFNFVRRKLESFANHIGECVYEVETNEISLAMTLGTIPVEKQTLFGSILFNRGITGARVIPANVKTITLEGCEFQNFGSHTDEKHGGYLNMACGVGMTEVEIDELFNRLPLAYSSFMKELHKDDRCSCNNLQDDDSI